MNEKLFEYTKKEKIFQCDLEKQACHASTIVKMSNGNLICAWFQGTKEGNDDVGIYGARRINGIWTSPVLLAKEDNMPCWNPVLFKKDDEHLVLFYKRGKEIATWQTMFKISMDYGENWSAAYEMVPGDFGGRGPVRNKCIRLKNGRILAPASLENGPWRCFADISDDNGKTWKKSNEIYIDLKKDCKMNEDFKAIPVSEQSYTGRGVIQPSLWEEGDDVHMVMRSSEGWVFHCFSKDQGESWSEAKQLEIPNNNSGIDAVMATDGNVYIVCNPVGESWGKRSPVCIYTRERNEWRELMILDAGEGEFSYPCIICEDDRLYITYTWKRVNVAFWELKLKS